jgi:hypothetical protein
MVTFAAALAAVLLVSTGNFSAPYVASAARTRKHALGQAAVGAAPRVMAKDSKFGTCGGVKPGRLRLDAS